MVQTVQNPKWFDVIFETSRPQQKRCRTPQNPKTTASLIKISSNPTASFGKNPPTNRWNLFQQKLCRLGLGLASLASVFLDWSFSSCRRLDELMDGWDPIRRTTQLPYLGCGFLVNQLDQQGCVFFKHFYDRESRNPQLNLHLPRFLGRTPWQTPWHSTEHSFAKGNNATITGVGGLDWKDVPGSKMPMIFSHRFSVFAERHPAASWMILLMWFSPEAWTAVISPHPGSKMKFISSVEKGSNPSSSG